MILPVTLYSWGTVASSPRFSALTFTLPGPAGSTWNISPMSSVLPRSLLSANSPMFSTRSPLSSSVARVGGRKKSMSNSNSVTGSVMCHFLSISKRNRSIFKKANSSAVISPETSKTASGARKRSAVSGALSWLRKLVASSSSLTLPSLSGSFRLKSTSAKTPPPTPPLANPTLSSAAAHSSPVRTTSGTSSPLPSGWSVSLT